MYPPPPRSTRTDTRFPDSTRCRSVADFADVVRWDRGGHADRNALGAVGQQVREAAGQDDRLFGLAVIGRAEVDGILVNALQQGGSDLGQARLGVAHRGSVIAVDVAELALAVDQREEQRETPRQGPSAVLDELAAARAVGRARGRG